MDPRVESNVWHLIASTPQGRHVWRSPRGTEQATEGKHEVPFLTAELTAVRTFLGWPTEELGPSGPWALSVSQGAPHPSLMQEATLHEEWPS